MKNRLTCVFILLILVPGASGAHGNAPTATTSNPTWHYQTSGGKRLYGIFFFDRLRGWAAGDDGTILHTGDGGLNWRSQNSSVGVGHHLGILSFVTPLKGWVTGTRGTILQTDDGGEIWQRQTTNTTNDLYGLFFLDENQGWAVGTGGLILHTINGGVSWYSQNSGTSDWLGRVQFINASEGWISGNSGLILHTANGGDSWQPQISGTTNQLNELFFIDQNQGWAVGNGGSIIHTLDGGDHWNPQSSGTTASLFSITFLNAREGWATGYGIILHTLDAGQTWTTELTTNFWIFETEFIDRYNGWVAADNGTILYYGYGMSSPTLHLPIPHDANENGLNRIWSFFDHEYPIYSAQPSAAVGTTMKYTGEKLSGTLSSCVAGVSCYSGHDGNDFSYGVSEGTPVLAAAAGEVSSGTDNCIGNYIKINHGHYQTIYEHLQDDIYWKRSGHVEVGDRIGSVGNSGNCSLGAHLHFGVYFDQNGNGDFEYPDELVDPYGWRNQCSPIANDPWTMVFRDKNNVQHAGATSSWLWAFDAPDCANISPESGQLLTGDAVIVNFPAGAINGSATVAYNSAPEPDRGLALSTNSQNTALSFTISTGHTFQITAIYTDGIPVSTFSAPVSITLTYTDTNVIYGDESSLGLYLWEQTNANWVLQNTTLDTISNQAVAAIDRPGIYSLRAYPLNLPPGVLSVSPAIGDNNKKLNVAITGTNFLLTPTINLGLGSLEVHFVSSSVLTATVPSQTASGTYDLTLRNPDGQTIVLHNALTILSPIYLPLIVK